VGGLVNIDVLGELILSYTKKNKLEHKLFIKDLFTASAVTYLLKTS
jgi:hypothetical protein